MTKINFQPMPKRFMMWSEQLNDFARREDGKPYVFENITFIAEWLSVNNLAYNKIKLVQSTNLFDKDGKEIFEGSIVEDFDELHWVVVIEDGMVRVRTEYERDEERRYLNRPISFLTEPGNWNQGNNEIEVIGHILSNPELMEKKNV